MVCLDECFHGYTLLLKLVIVSASLCSFAWEAGHLLLIVDYRTILLSEIALKTKQSVNLCQPTSDQTTGSILCRNNVLEH